MKTCRGCNVTKPLDGFYKEMRGKFGVMSKCKPCMNRITAERIKQSKKCQETRRAYRQTEAYKKAQRLRQKLDCQKFPLRHKARQLVSYALKSGKLQRLPCEICGNARSEAHHDDYSQPLQVRWLCTMHHKELHIFLKRKEAA